MFRYEYRTMRVPKLSRHDCITQYPVVRKILILNFVVVKRAMPVNAHIASYGMLRVRRLFRYLCGVRGLMWVFLKAPEVSLCNNADNWQDCYFARVL